MIRIKPDGGTKRLTALVGIDDEVGEKGTAEFIVGGDDYSHDHADWVEAKFEVTGNPPKTTGVPVGPTCRPTGPSSRS